MGIIDILVIATFVISIICALYRGLVKELLSISSWILAGLGALYGFTYLRPVFGFFMENETAIDLTGGAVIALTILIILTIINARITKKLRKSSLSGLDRILGFAFGIFRAVLLIAVVFLVAKIPFSRHQIKDATEENFTMPYIIKSGEMLQEILPQNFTEDVKEESSKAIEKAKKSSEKAVDNATSKAADKVNKKVTAYTEKQRESLDDLIENIDIED